MLPLLAAVTLALAAQPPAPQSTPPDAPVAKQGNKKMTRHDKSTQAPDLDLIGYLGDYSDAADGLDPMGLADNAAAPKAAKIPPKSAPDAQP
ncbi:MAG TPA: hypothetical protein VFF05_06065 [Rudaea sp.]|jgi:hypothetical protein|nr:hypothetical protein [Rudaea sp.]